ncbi:MAG: hypothetical protein JSV49_11370, partial [Thermoplasmata archaeon]
KIMVVVNMKKLLIVLFGIVLITSTILIMNPIGGMETGFKSVAITSPEDNSKVSGVVKITAEVMACYCNEKSSLYVDDEFITEGTRTGMSEDGNYEIFIHEWDSAEVADGEHDIKVYDKHGEYYDEITITVENGENNTAGPDNTRIISPEDNAEVSGDVTITVEVMTCDCPGRSSLYVDGEFVNEGSPGKITTDEEHEIFFHVWDSTKAVDGEHEIKVYGKHDEYYDEITLRVKNGGGGEDPEIIRIDKPEDNAEVNGIVTIIAEVLACFCDGKTSLYVDGEFITEGTRAAISEGGEYEIFTHEWDSTSVTNGGHKIMVFGKHEENSDGIAVFVNNEGGGAPEKDIRIFTPLDDELCEGKIILKVEVISDGFSDAPLMYVNNEFVTEGQLIDEIEYDGETYDIYEYEWDSTEVDDGIYSIQIKSQQSEEYDEIQLRVSNDSGITSDGETDPKNSDGSGTYLWTIIIALIGIIVILLLVLKKRQKD